MPAAGAYNVDARVASGVSGSGFELRLGGAAIALFAVPNTGGWQTWQTLSKSGVPLTAGQHVLQVYTTATGYNLDWIKFSSATTPVPPTRSPFLGTPFGIPTTIQAEDFDKGGPGVAFSDTDAGNTGRAYRPTEGVDIEGTAGGGYNVGWTQAGEWMNYTVNVPPEGGTYNIDARVASGLNASGFSLRLDGTTVASFSVGNTGGWQTWQMLSKAGISLPGGQHTLQVFTTTTGYNLDWLRFVAPSSTAPTVTVISPNGGETWQAGSAGAITWTTGGDVSRVSNFAVSYSLDGGATYANSIGTVPGTSNSIPWTPPLVLSLTAQLRIRVQARDASNTVLASDASNGTFTIGSTAARSIIWQSNFVGTSGQQLQLAGRLIDGQGRPIAGATLPGQDSLRRMSMLNVADTPTDANGYFQITYSSMITSQRSGIFPVKVGDTEIVVSLSPASRPPFSSTTSRLLLSSPNAYSTAITPDTRAVGVLSDGLYSWSSIPSLQEVLTAGKSVALSIGDWLGDSTNEFMANPVNRAAVATSVACAPAAATPFCAAVITYTTTSFVETAAVNLIKRGVNAIPGMSDPLRRDLLATVDGADFVYGLVTIKPARGVQQVTSAALDAVSLIWDGKQLFEPVYAPSGQVVGMNMCFNATDGNVYVMSGKRRESTSLPAPWSHDDVGSPLEGSAGYTNGTFTVQGSGADIWGTGDAFRYVNQTLTGDGEIVARVTGLQNTDPWAKAGVMIRETLASNSKFADMVITPGNGASFQYRNATGGECGFVTRAGIVTPQWVKLARSGSTFTGFVSGDGTNWTQVGSATLTMGSSVTVGLAVTSHNSSVRTTATFTNASVTPTLNISQRPSVHHQSRGSAVVDLIILHTVVLSGNPGSFEGQVSYLQNNDRGVSAHYVVGADGAIAQLVSLDRAAIHAESWNNRSIGIEIVASADDPNAWTRDVRLLARLADLVAWLCSSRNVPVVHASGSATSGNGYTFTGTGIVGHYQASTSGKTDPGPHFPWEDFINMIELRTEA